MYTIKVKTFYFYITTSFDRRFYNLSNRGMLRIHLSSLLQASGMSKNKFCQKAEIQRSQLKGYMDNTITRLDTDVLIRICHTLDCSISDLLEYVSPEQAEK
ncbi:MAG: helix-turn-helix transcriptional regulator [Lachnospiraceae bacterium]|nr:helix-turn-helix transcriptional regulator [Lachnospiraceae bacterium]